MSATWYTWLEQKRPIGVSASVLDKLARVLRLDPTERMQLCQLAFFAERSASAGTRSSSSGQLHVFFAT